MASTMNLIAGDSYSESVSVAAYPATAGWVLKQRLTPRASAGTPINLTAIAEGDAYRLSETAVNTANWAAGAYTWSRWVEKAGEVYTVATGQLTVLPLSLIHI